MAFRASETPDEMDAEGSHKLAAYSQFIFDACIANCDTIGTDKHGCCVMQRCLEKGLRTQKLALADKIIERLFLFIEDPFGNYLV